MKLIYEFSPEQIVQVYGLYDHAWWAKSRTLEETRSCVQGSQLCIGALDNNDQLVGFARVISDFTFKAVIFDVIVHPSQRGIGLGTTLMNAIRTHDKLKQVKHFELYCLPEMESYYEQLGFSADVGGIRLMRQENA
ncbi:GNAT family N-acetyltransferase [Vibrio vulnificus]|nr:GNAT family N-acetyltransferase [Vibrio vulnificus]